MKKRIAFVLGSMTRGGGEKVISVLTHEYTVKGWDTDIIVLLSNDCKYPLPESTRFIDFSGDTESRLKRVPYWLKQLKKYAKENKPDVMLSFFARINVIAQIACKKYVPKFFVSERNDPRCDGRSKLIDIITKVLYPKTDGVVFQTKRAKEYFPKLKNGQIIANPISVSVFASDRKCKKIVNVGNLWAQKNQKMLIEAFASIASDYPEYRLEIYGEGEFKTQLEAQIEECGLVDRVFLMGNRSNIHECIADAELFILSSDYEGLSNALLEALTMGLPCISTDCAGSDEYITDGVNGVLTPVGNPRAMAQNIRRMLDDDNLRCNCGQNAAKDAMSYSKEIVLQKWHDLMD